MKHAITIAAVLTLAACADPASRAPAEEGAGVKVWAYEDAALFPEDRTLVRPEDGVALPDGRLLVADQEFGLAAISPQGVRTKFGGFAEAGYVHNPPESVAAPNGVSLEPDGRHVLVADVFTGAIYRTDIETGETALAWQHAYGVNTAVADETGAIWFTQSTENAPPEGDRRLFTAIDRPMADGALYRLPPAAENGTRSAPELKADGLYFANGVLADSGNGVLYLSETMAGRIIAYDFDAASGEISNSWVIAEMLGPDNVEMDEDGMLWVASALGNAIVVIDPASGEKTTVFHPQTEGGDAVIAEWDRRMTAGEPLLDLMTPPMWEPLPGLTTGIILTPGNGPVYVSGAGDALVRLER